MNSARNPGNPRAEYVRRMHRVLAHIDAHLAEPLELADLAAVAHFSPFHFHRLFSAWMGETFGEYLRRRRLEVAAQRLITQPSSAVLEIALVVGFGSGEAFARAFKQRFGVSATAWRELQAAAREAELSKLGQALRNPDQAPGAPGSDDAAALQRLQEFLMQVTVIERPEVLIAYMRHVGPYGPPIGRFWQEQFHPFLARHSLYGRPMYGISHDDPAITAPEKLRYDACIEVDAGFQPGSGALLGRLAGGRYAAVPFKGTSETIGAAWMALMRDWLPGSGFQLDGRPCFEYYPPDARYDVATGEFSCQIVIPLAPL